MNSRFQELELTADEKEEFLEEVLTRDHYLGHYAYEYTNDRYNADLYQKLFNWHPDHFHEGEGVRPSIILGRRGSGKSSYLNNLAHKENVIPVAVESWDAVDIVEEYVNEILQTKISLAAEKVADIWHLIFLTLATRELAKYNIEDNRFKQFIKTFPVANVAKLTLVTVVTGVMNLFKEKYFARNTRLFNVGLIIEAMELGCDSLASWETLLSDAAKKIDKTVILMMDNPEQLEIHGKYAEEANWDEAYRNYSIARRRAYAGLLTLLAHFNKGKARIQVRYCVPAEQYVYLVEQSSAVLKDFANIQLLHWSSGDLLSSVAHRYMICLQLHTNNRSDIRYHELKQIDIYTREGAYEFFNKILEGPLINERGYKESPIDFLVRHTQLLPRQIIIYFNSAIELMLNENPNADLTRLKPDYIRASVEAQEGLLATEVVDSYKSIYPEGREVINKLVNFPVLATCKEIKEGWSVFEAKKVLQKYKMYPQVTVDSDRFLEFLIVTGIIGVVQRYHQGSIYINADYDYTLAKPLKLQPHDMVAVHPIFSSITCAETHETLKEHTGIYPKGTSIEEHQDTHLLRNKFIRSA